MHLMRILLAGAMFGVPFAAEATPPVLAAHRAVYDISLLEAAEGAGVAGVSGRMVLEFTGSECAGYTSELRFVTETEGTDGTRQVIDSRSRIVESAGGRALDFASQTYAGSMLAEESEGKADRDDGQITVALSRPGEKRFAIGEDVIFPTQQMERIIGAAREGKSFVSFAVYDGSERGETVFDSAGVIGKPSSVTDDATSELAIAEAGMAGMRHWPVTLSYFDQRGGGEETPFYVMSLVVYDNGIGRTMKIDYGDFVLAGRMTGLEMLPETPCAETAPTAIDH